MFAPTQPEPRWARYALPAAALLVGLWFAHRPIVLSGFALTHGDAGDARFVNYILEHGWRWVLQREPHTRFWDMPFMYPHANVAAYSEVMLGVGPFYWFWRAVGFREDTAYQLWMMTVSVLNFASAYWVMRRVFGFHALAATAGAFVLAFGLPRTNQLNHSQLLAHFWALGAIYVGARMLGLPAHGERGRQAQPEPQEAPPETQDSRWKRRGFIFAFFACLSLQLWSGYYVGWFFGLGLGIALFWALWNAQTRRAVFALLKAEPAAIAVSAALAALSVWPMASHYWAATREVGMREFVHVLVKIPRPLSWIHMGSHSALYSWMMRHFEAFGQIPVEGEHRIGVGLLTTVAWIAGLWLGRKRPVLLVLLLTAGTVILLATVWPNGTTLWEAVYLLIPGGKAINAVCRIGLFLLIPISIGVAALADLLIEKGKGWEAALLAIVCMAEQSFIPPMYNKLPLREHVAVLASKIDPSCKSFLFSPLLSRSPGFKTQIDAMYAGLAVNRPTLNGYSGHGAPGWNLGDTNIWSPERKEQVAGALAQWTSLKGLSEKDVCWVIARHELGPLESEFVSQAVPEAVAPGQSFEVTFTFRNGGRVAWSPAAGDRLGLFMSRAVLEGPRMLNLNAEVPPGEQARFTATLRAPLQPGKYVATWRMLRGSAWFGAPTPTTTIHVEPLAAGSPVGQ